MEDICSTSLDDSLTSIQWLCQLESDKIVKDDAPGVVIKNESHVACKSGRSMQQQHGDNPYQKPHYSYATLIVFAINSSQEKRMTLQEIYAWIEQNYPFYKFAKKGWKNSIRHNLSLHKFFIKEKRPVLHGKGSYWRISPEGKENLVRDMMKQSHNRLQPPYTLLPYDPSRKFRPIMPKPSTDLDPSRMCYVPLEIVACNLPVVFVPSPAVSSATPEGPAGVDTREHTRMVQAFPATETKTVASPKTSDVCNDASTYPNVSPHKSLKRKSSHETTAVLDARAQTSTARFSVKKEKVDNMASCCQTSIIKSPTSIIKSPTSIIKTPTSIIKTPTSIIKSPTNSKPLPNILRRKRKTEVRSPVPRSKVQTPQKSAAQSTLAAINSGVHLVACSPNFGYDDFVTSLAEFTSSPLRQNVSFDFLQSSFGSPGFSPLRSPLRFGAPTGFTPGRHEADSGIMMTPVKGFGDLSFNWTPFKTGLTPLLYSPPRNEVANASGHQGCRKSLGLEKINEADECAGGSSSW